MGGYARFSHWISITLVKVYISLIIINLGKNTFELVGPFFKIAINFVFQWVDDMASAGANQYTFHIEATDKPLELIEQIKKAGMKVGVGVKPNTPVESVLPLVNLVDMVLIMTVEPGFGGQKFMANMMPKVGENASSCRVGKRTFPLHCTSQQCKLLRSPRDKFFVSLSSNVAQL